MRILDRLTDRVDQISGRVGDFLDTVLLPEDVAAALGHAQEALDRGAIDEARPVIEQILGAHPELHRAHFLLGICDAQRGEHEQALDRFQRAAALREEAAYHLHLGLTHEQLDHPHQAILHFQRSLELKEHPAFAFELYMGLGRQYMASGRADKAARELRKALRDRPDHPGATLQLAEALLTRGELEPARALLQACRADALPLERALLLGRVEEADGALTAARGHYQDALKVAPTHVAARLGAARACLAAGELVAANEHLLHAIASTPEAPPPELHLLRGRVAEGLSQRAEALDHYETAINAGAGALASLGAARILLAEGAPERAAERLARMLEVQPDAPDTSAEATLLLGQARLAMGDLTTARRLLDRARQAFDEPRADVLRSLAEVALAGGDPAEAIVALEEARTTTRGAVTRLDHLQRRATELLRPQWTLPASIDHTRHLSSLLQALRAHLRTDPRLAAFDARAHALEQTLDSPLSIAIAGEFNAGKSTLLNALLGEDVVPMGVLPTTAHTCHIQWGPRRAAQIHRVEAEVIEVTLAEARDQMRRDADHIDHLEFVYPHPDLRSVEFWDTPGFNALEARHERVAARALTQAEAIIWVLDAGQALSQSEWARIDEIPDSDERLLLVLNKVDRLGPPGPARREALSSILEHLDEHALGRVAGVFPVSARQAMQQAQQAAPGEASDSFSAFRAFLNQRIVERSGRIKTLEVSRQLGTLIDDILAVRAEALATYDSLQVVVDDLDAWLRARQRVLPAERAATLAETLRDQFDFVITGVERELAQTLRSRGTILTRGVLADEDREFILTLIRERVDDVLHGAHRGILAHVGTLEEALAARLETISEALDVADARALQRRLDGFFDEVRVLEMLLEERVFGRLRARARATLDATGDATLESIRARASNSTQPWHDRLRALLPASDDHVEAEVERWYEEFFLAARRFSDRLRRDLHLLKMEATHRLDVSEVNELVHLC